MILKTFISWLPGIPIAILNGLLRQSFYLTFLPELGAHQLSAVSFIVFFGVYVWFVLRWLKLPSRKAALGLGLAWMLLTILFEFVFGHFVMGHAWAKLFHDYNLFAGRVWVLVLVWIAISPLLFFGMQKKRTKTAG